MAATQLQLGAGRSSHGLAEHLGLARALCRAMLVGVATGGVSTVLTALGTAASVVVAVALLALLARRTLGVPVGWSRAVVVGLGVVALGVPILNLVADRLELVDTANGGRLYDPGAATLLAVLTVAWVFLFGLLAVAVLYSPECVTTQTSDGGVLNGISLLRSGRPAIGRWNPSGNSCSRAARPRACWPVELTSSNVTCMGDVVPIRKSESSGWEQVLERDLLERGGSTIRGERDRVAAWRSEARAIGRRLSRSVRTGYDEGSTLAWAELTDWPRDHNERALQRTAMRRAVESLPDVTKPS